MLNILNFYLNISQRFKSFIGKNEYDDNLNPYLDDVKAQNQIWKTTQFILKNLKLIFNIILSSINTLN